MLPAVSSVCLLALLPAVPGVSVPEHHHELGHPHHGAVGGAQHRARAQQRPAAERVETGDAEMGFLFVLACMPLRDKQDIEGLA